jgi:hypothetical protein
VVSFTEQCIGTQSKKLRKGWKLFLTFGKEPQWYHTSPPEGNNVGSLGIRKVASLASTQKKKSRQRLLQEEKLIRHASKQLEKECLKKELVDIY